MRRTRRFHPREMYAVEGYEPSVSRLLWVVVVAAVVAFAVLWWLT
jgi:hypothetical protein